MSTTSTGREAEQLVADILKKSGHKILELNWRVRRAEIDLVTKYKKTIHFTEVKYRKNDTHGGGFEYITAGKLRQMRFAAELWVTENNWTGDYCLQAASVDSLGVIQIVDC